MNESWMNREGGGGLGGRRGVSVAAPHAQRDYGGGLAGRAAMPVRSGNGLRVTGDAGSMVLRLEEELPTYGRLLPLAGAAVAAHPFKCPSATDGSTASVIAGGTVNGTAVTNNGGTALPGGTLVISNSGTVYVSLEVTITKNVTAGGYVSSIASIPTAKMKTGSSVPADTATVLYKQVATYVSGARTTQDRITSMEVAIRGTNASGGFLTFWGAA